MPYPLMTLRSRLWPALLITAALAGCTQGDTLEEVDNDPAPTGDFELHAGDNLPVLIEGDENGAQIPINLVRTNGHDRPVELAIAAATDAEAQGVTAAWSQNDLTRGADNSQVTVHLAPTTLPIQAQQRHFIITASDGQGSDQVSVSLDIQPTSAPDVYLLIGQSNMVGFSGEGTRESFPGGPDEPHPRIFQLNVTRNDPEGVFGTAAAWGDPAANAIGPLIVQAEDPLHVPLEPETRHKEEDYIGMGMSFAKRALADTTANIILVPAAWSGSSFCTNDEGPVGQWNATSSDDPSAGNSLLYERAVTRATLALQETRGVLRGILWHQGESDANDACAARYRENLTQLVNGLRERLLPVSGLTNAEQTGSTIPFVLGTMSIGDDARGKVSDFNDAKRIIDQVHRSFAGSLPLTALSIHDDLIPDNGYPCGNGTCIHFGAEALREIGHRYYDALRSVAADG